MLWIAMFVCDLPMSFYSYECADYVLNDNAAGDVKILRCALSAVTSQSLKGVPGRSKRLLRSQSFVGFNSELDKQLRREDRNYTALWFRRYYQMAKAFCAWKQAAGIRKEETAAEDAGGNSVGPVEERLIEGTPVTLSKKRAALIPGITGLRNLGNTCYMNSVLQVLRYLLSYSHLRDFREFFLRLKDSAGTSSNISSSQSNVASEAKFTSKAEQQQQRQKHLLRKTTMECFQVRFPLQATVVGDSGC